LSLISTYSAGPGRQNQNNGVQLALGPGIKAGAFSLVGTTVGTIPSDLISVEQFWNREISGISFNQMLMTGQYKRLNSRLNKEI
jgi:hypothetical protein